MPGLAEALFSIEEGIDTGLVWNEDSIRFGTRLDSVVPKYTLEATAGAAFITSPDTVCELTGYDTLDFTKSPIYLTIRSSDGTTTKVYEIVTTVHQVDPDLYTWQQLTSSIYPTDESEQQVVELNGAFVMITDNGFQKQAYSSINGEQWMALGQTQNLPAGAHIRQIISDGKQLYYADAKSIYTSNNAIQWTKIDINYHTYTMLLYWNQAIWALVENNGYELAIWDGQQMQLSGLRPTNNFPLGNFASVCFQSASLRERAMIIGGFAKNGQALNTRWNLEYSPNIATNNGYRIEEFTIDRPNFTTLTGVSVIWYNKQLLMFGGVDEDMNYIGRDILYSKDEGLNWYMVDTTKNQLPAHYLARQKQNAIVKDNNIYLFGGQDKNNTYSDVYRGRLNSIDWDK